MLVPRRVWNILTRGVDVKRKDQPTFGDVKPLKLDSSPLKNDGLKTDPVSFRGEAASFQGQTATLPKTNS